jgi:outer membrane murein-binding lipoprotein Lpp
VSSSSPHPLTTTITLEDSRSGPSHANMDVPSQITAFLQQIPAQAAVIQTLSAKVDGLSTKVDDLTSTVTRLSAENAAQAASIAYLSSENAGLRAAERRQHQVNVELLAKVVPDGFPLWDGPDGPGRQADRGRWIWSSVSPATLLPSKSR